MAKISFTKLGLKVNQEVKTIKYNEQIIEVKQYLPIQKKLELISNVINLSADVNNFANPVKVSVFTTLEIIDKYTNLSFTEKQKEDPAKLYDLLTGCDLIKNVINAIPEAEYEEVIRGVKDSIDAYYSYRNSVLGVLDIVNSDYQNMSTDTEALEERMKDFDNMGFLKEVVEKLG